MERIISGMAGAKHPLVSAHRTHAAPHLVSQRLECEPTISGSKRAGESVTRAIRFPCRKKDADGSFVAPIEQLVVAIERDFRAARRFRPRRQMETMKVVEKEQRADAFVQILARAPKLFQRGSLGKQLVGRGAPAERVDRTVADFRIRGRNDFPEFAQPSAPCSGSTARAAKTFTSCVSTSARSWPLSARAS